MTRILTNATSNSKADWVDTQATDERRLRDLRYYAARARGEHVERAAYFLAYRQDALGADAIASLMACSRDGSERHHWWRAFVAVQQRIGASND
jgi:hypothetical protein